MHGQAYAQRQKQRDQKKIRVESSSNVSELVHGELGIRPGYIQQMANHHFLQLWGGVKREAECGRVKTKPICSPLKRQLKAARRVSYCSSYAHNTNQTYPQTSVCYQATTCNQQISLPPLSARMDKAQTCTVAHGFEKGKKSKSRGVIFCKLLKRFLAIRPVPSPTSLGSSLP